MRDCSCLGTSFSAPDVSPDYSKCLCGTNKFIAPDDGPNPCSENFSYNLLDMFEVQACDGSIEYEIVSLSGFESASISGGEFTAVTSGEPGGIYNVTILASCVDTQLSVMATLQVGFQDLCKGVECEGNETCNPCTGNCEDNQVDLEIS